MIITQLPPLSLYIHIPWCVKKCPYCDFNSHQMKEALPEDLYINRLLLDLEQEIPQVWGRQIISIFIGGGTPSLFSAKGIEQLLSGVRALIPFHADIEITMEANPGTFESEKFNGFYQAGINRLSIGVQSFSNFSLKKLGRIHNANEANKAFLIAREAGFKNINLDLMYALPEQSLEQAMNDLNIAIDLSPEHISWYQLTLEPNTVFYNRPPQLPNDDQAISMSEKGIQLLKENNYFQYEVSAYSKDNAYLSQHNLNYWQFGDYLGIGTGAHQKITRADTQTICRKSKRRQPKDYLNPEKSLIASEKNIPQEELPLEFMMNALRLKDGIEQNEFFNRTGLLLTQIEDVITRTEKAGLLTRQDNKIKTTKKGYAFLNETLEHFMPENFSHLSKKRDIIIKSI